MNSIIKGVQTKVRFTVSGNVLSMEDLFSLPLSTSGTRLSLDDVAVAVNSELQKGSQSFVNDLSKAGTELQLKMDIILDIISIRKAQNEAMLAENIRVSRINELKELLAAKKGKEALKRSLKSIEEELASLEA